MPLTWEIDKIENYKELCWLPDSKEGEELKFRVSPITEVLIWRTMVVDMGKITSENVNEFAWRLMLYEKIFGGAILDNGEERALTYEEVRAHIGLVTNVSTTSRTAWRKRLLKMIENEFGWQVKREIEKAKA